MRRGFWVHRLLVAGEGRGWDGRDREVRRRLLTVVRWKYLHVVSGFGKRCDALLTVVARRNDGLVGTGGEGKCWDDMCEICAHGDDLCFTFVSGGLRSLCGGEGIHTVSTVDYSTLCTCSRPTVTDSGSWFRRRRRRQLGGLRRSPAYMYQH